MRLIAKFKCYVWLSKSRRSKVAKEQSEIPSGITDVNLLLAKSNRSTSKGSEGIPKGVRVDVRAIEGTEVFRVGVLKTRVPSDCRNLMVGISQVGASRAGSPHSFVCH